MKLIRQAIKAPHRRRTCSRDNPHTSQFKIQGNDFQSNIVHKFLV